MVNRIACAVLGAHMKEARAAVESAKDRLSEYAGHTRLEPDFAGLDERDVAEREYRQLMVDKALLEAVAHKACPAQIAHAQSSGTGASDAKSAVAADTGKKEAETTKKDDIVHAVADVPKPAPAPPAETAGGASVPKP